MFHVAVLVAFVAVLLLGANAAYADGVVERTVDGEQLTVNYSEPSTVDKDAEYYGSNVTVIDDEDKVLTNGTDYVWHPSNGTVVWNDTAETQEGESAFIDYTYYVYTKATELMWGILRAFGGAIWVILFGVMVFAAWGLAHGDAGGRGGGGGL